MTKEKCVGVVGVRNDLVGRMEKRVKLKVERGVSPKGTDVRGCQGRADGGSITIDTQW